MSARNKMKIFHIFFMCLMPFTLVSNDILKDYSIYFLGAVRHFEPIDKTNEGNLDYLAISKLYKNDLWHFENGIGTFIDSYHIRSYTAFSNISHEHYKLGVLTPILGLNCYYKGKNYDSTERRFRCHPALKLRIGKEEGFFLNIMPIPKVEGLTDGFITVELGYKF
jgi:hypothetical protein